MKKLIVMLLSGVLFFAGCTTASSTSSTTSTKVETLSEQYKELPEDNQFYTMEKDSVKTFLEHGTGVLLLSFPGCPWCQAYINQLNDVLVANKLKAAYYNIRVDKDDDRTFYDEVSELIQNLNETGEDIIQYDNDGKPVIYMPLVLFVENGKIVAFDNETSMISSDEVTPEEYWSEDKKKALNEKLNTASASVKELQDANDAKGCDTGCKVE